MLGGGQRELRLAARQFAFSALPRLAAIAIYSYATEKGQQKAVDFMGKTISG
jgi:hypothetical protein